MEYVCYRKSDLQIVGYSGTGVDPEQRTGEQEIELNIIPVFGGSLEDYSYIVIDDETAMQKIGRLCRIEEVDGVPTFIIGGPKPAPPPSPTTEDQLMLALTDAQMRIAEQQALIDQLALAVTELQLQGGEQNVV